MGHSVITCDNCNTYIMEGRNDWECDECGWYFNPLTCPNGTMEDRKEFVEDPCKDS